MAAGRPGIALSGSATVVVVEMEVMVVEVVEVMVVWEVVVVVIVLVLPQPTNEILNTIMIASTKNMSLFILSFHSFIYSSNQL